MRVSKSRSSGILVIFDTVNTTSNATRYAHRRIGYYTVDDDTTYNAKTGEGKVVFNSIVSLKEEKR